MSGKFETVIVISVPGGPEIGLTVISGSLRWLASYFAQAWFDIGNISKSEIIANERSFLKLG